MHGSEKWKWSRSVVSDSSRPHGLQPTRLLHPWDFPGKSTGVGCHCLLRIGGIPKWKFKQKEDRNFVYMPMNDAISNTDMISNWKEDGMKLYGMVTIITILPLRTYNIGHVTKIMITMLGQTTYWDCFCLEGLSKELVIYNHSAGSLTTTCYIDSLFEALSNLSYLHQISFHFEIQTQVDKW